MAIDYYIDNDNKNDANSHDNNDSNDDIKDNGNKLYQ